MSHDTTNCNKIIANNILTRQYTTKLMLVICYVLLKSKSFYSAHFYCFFVKKRLCIYLNDRGYGFHRFLYGYVNVDSKAYFM